MQKHTMVLNEQANFAKISFVPKLGVRWLCNVLTFLSIEYLIKEWTGEILTGDLKSKSEAAAILQHVHIANDLWFYLRCDVMSRPAALYLGLPSAALTLGPGVFGPMIKGRHPHLATKGRGNKNRDLFHSIPVGPSASLTSIFLHLPFYLHLSFPTACLLNFKLQSQMQRRQPCRHCLTSSCNYIRSLKDN